MYGLTRLTHSTRHNSHHLPIGEMKNVMQNMCFSCGANSKWACCFNWDIIRDISLVQNKETALGLVVAETRGRVAAPQASGSLPWIGVDDPSARFTKKNGGLADMWYVDDGDIMCHPILVPSHLHEFDDANAKVGAEREGQRKVKLFTAETTTARSTTHGVAVVAPTVHCGPACGQGRRHSSNVRTRPAVSGPADRLCPPSRKSWSQSYEPHRSSARPRSCRRNEPLKSTTRLDSDLLSGSSWFSRTTGRSKRHSPQASTG